MTYQTDELNLLERYILLLKDINKTEKEINKLNEQIKYRKETLDCITKNLNNLNTFTLDGKYTITIKKKNEFTHESKNE